MIVKRLVVMILASVFVPTVNSVVNKPVDPLNKLVKAVIQVESNGNPKAVSNKGAIGLMQVRWSVWHKELKKQGIATRREQLFNPETNIKAGRFILTHYLHKTGDLNHALHKYSGGAKGYAGKVKKQMEVLDDEQ